MTSRLGRSAFALCVLLGATARSSAEETVCRRYDAEHENNLLAYNGCMHEQRIARLKVATWIERVANIKDAWSEEGTIDIAVARQKGERWALILDECLAIHKWSPPSNKFWRVAECRFGGGSQQRSSCP